MAGLKIDDAFPRVISAKTHGVIDYIHAGTNIVVGALFSRRNGPAGAAAYALGGFVLANALMTDYPLGVFRLYSFKVHGMLDYGLAATCAVLPNVLGIEDTRESGYCRAQGAGETVVAGITDYDDDSGSRGGQNIERFRIRR